MRIGNALLALGVMAIPALAADYSLELNSETTKIQWVLGDALHTVHGTFNLKRGAIDFDTDTGKASGQVVVDVASGASGSEARDRRMHASVLESAKYPEAIFTPSRIEGSLPASGTSNIKVHGTFMIHGAEHEVTMDVQATASTSQIRATCEFDIPYVAWGMKNPSNFLLRVGKTVRVSIEASGPLQTR
jgi:polyisoprenoid-binding protein YceI